MITMTPLPKWAKLLCPPFGTALDDAELAAPWLATGLGGVEAFWFSRSAWALPAIIRWWQAQNQGEKPTLWMPDYFCNQSLAAAREGGARIVFYPVTMGLEPDWSQCESMIKDAPPDLFVLVHYFGSPADAATAKAFCAAAGALLVEDAAHVLRPVAGIGEQGDFVFYSPHKVLAIPDGSLLLARSKEGGEVIRDAANGVPSASGAWAVKRALQKILPGGVLTRRARKRKPAFLDDPPALALAKTPGLSPMARIMLADAAQSLEEAALARRHNWAALSRSLEGLPACRPVQIKDGTAPYRLALLCDDGQAAAALFDDCYACGLPAESWPDLPDEVIADPQRHEAAITLRRSLVLLPVHQTADAEELVKLASHMVK